MIKKLLLLSVSMVLTFVVGMSVYANRTLALPVTPFEFELQQGGHLKSMARELHVAGLLEQDWAFVWLVRLLGKSSEIKAGYYALQQPVTPLELLEIFHKGAVIQRQVSIIEGWSFKQFREVLNANPDLKHVTKDWSDAEILKSIGALEAHPEGMFFPDTYRFAVGSRDITIFKHAYQTMQQRLQEAWANRESNLPLKTPYEALILASIVEKETGAASDRSMIAGVFVNRLRRGMRMQTDPTVIYGMGEKFDGNLRRRDLKTDTIYNTYTRRGLPPTPIALPSLASLQAALHPAKTKALYFVARGDGSSQFSNNLIKHNRAVRKYQQ